MYIAPLQPQHNMIHKSVSQSLDKHLSLLKEFI